MKKKIIFIIIESVKRELDSKILLSLKALKRNYRVLIGHKGALRELIKDTNPGIMLLKSFGPRNTKNIDFLKKKNFKIVSSDEELITAIDFDDKLNYRINNENIYKLDMFLAVGEKSDIPILKKRYNFLMAKVVLIGNMRLELLKKKYRNIFEKNSELIKKKFGNFFLLLTCFPHINKVQPSHRIDWVYHRIVEFGDDPDSSGIHLANEQVILQRETLMQTLKFINNFSKNFPNKNLIISPHPNEKVDFWKNFLDKKKFKNIFLNLEKFSSTNDFIHSCEICISSNSTALLEAFFLEKNVINFLAKNPNLAEINLLKKISKVVRSEDELITAIKDIEKIKCKNTTAVDELDEIANFKENFDSFETVLNSLDKLPEVNTYDSLFKNSFYAIINKLRMFKTFIKKMISFKLRLKPRIKYLYEQKIGNTLIKKNFIKRVEHINSFEKTENLIIKQIASEVFLFDTHKKY